MNPQQALIVALEMLRAQVTDLSRVIADNNDLTEEQLRDRGKGGRGRAADSEGLAGRAGKSIVGMAGMIGAKFAALIGPAAILGQALSAPISGLQVLGTAAKLLGTTLAPVLLPAVLLLSAGMVALSEIVHEEMMGSFDELANFIFDVGIPALVAFVEAAQTFVKWIEEYGGGIFGGIGRGATAADFWSLLTGDVSSVGASGGILAALGGGGSTAAGGSVTGGRGGRMDARELVSSGLRDSLTSLRRSLGPPASFSSLEGLSRAGQLAASNGDPLEQKIMKQQLEVLERIERALAGRGDRSGKRVYDPTRGSGGAVGGDF